MIKKKIVFYLISFLVLSLTACSGWHLAGQFDWPSSLQPLLITPDDPYGDLQRNLRQQLQNNGVELTDISDNADSRLHIIQERFITRQETIGSDGQIKEQELIYTLAFILKDKTGKVLIDRKTIQINHSIFFDQDAILQSKQEKEQQQHEMRLEAIDQLLWQLRRVSSIQKSS